MAEELKPLRWKKIGGGSYRFSGRIIKPGQIFEAFEHEIPLAFRPSFICLDDEKLKEMEVKKVEKARIPEDLYETKERSKGWFDVVNKSTGKSLNEKALREDEAKKLIITLKS